MNTFDQAVSYLKNDFQTLWNLVLVESEKSPNSVLGGGNLVFAQMCGILMELFRRQDIALARTYFNDLANHFAESSDLWREHELYLSDEGLHILAIKGPLAVDAQKFNPKQISRYPDHLQWKDEQLIFRPDECFGDLLWLYGQYKAARTKPKG